MERYHQAYQKKNCEDCKVLIDSITENVLTGLHNSAYKSFFTPPERKEEISVLDKAIESSRLDGAIPDDSNRSVQYSEDDVKDASFKEEVKNITVSGKDLTDNIDSTEMNDDSEDLRIDSTLNDDQNKYSQTEVEKFEEENEDKFADEILSIRKKDDDKNDDENDDLLSQF